MDKYFKNYLVFISLGQIGICLSALILSWQLFTDNASLENIPAMLGYICSIFGLVAATCTLYGVNNSKPVWLLVHCVLGVITFTLILPTLGAHLYMLAAAAEGNPALLPLQTMTTARSNAWSLSTMIIILALMILLFIATILMAWVVQEHLYEQQECKERILQYMQREDNLEKVRRNYQDLIMTISDKGTEQTFVV
jgi:hypothetical protein